MIKATSHGVSELYARRSDRHRQDFSNIMLNNILDMTENQMMIISTLNYYKISWMITLQTLNFFLVVKPVVGYLGRQQDCTIGQPIWRWTDVPRPWLCRKGEADIVCS